jgi:hypothetical protein
MDVRMGRTLFNDILSSQLLLSSEKYERMTAFVKYESIGEEAVVAYLKVLFQNSTGKSEENHDTRCDSWCSGWVSNRLD